MFRTLPALALIALVAMTAGLAPAASLGPEVTLKGNVVCNRATLTTPWDGTSQGGEHFPVMYAVEGTTGIAAARDEIMRKLWPTKGLDVEGAQKLQSAWTRRLTYRLAPGPLTDKIHKEVEWGSQVLALTGVLSEKEGQRWIAVSSYAPTTVAYPAPMLAPDKPFVVLPLDGQNRLC